MRNADMKKGRGGKPSVYLAAGGVLAQYGVHFGVVGIICNREGLPPVDNVKRKVCCF